MLTVILPGQAAEARVGYELLRDVRALSQLGYAYAIAGDVEQANAILSDLKARAKHEAIPSITIAQVEVGLGHKDAAFAWLSRAVDEHEPMALVVNGPVFAPLRPMSQYQELAARSGPGPTQTSAEQRP